MFDQQGETQFITSLASFIRMTGIDQFQGFVFQLFGLLFNKLPQHVTVMWSVSFCCAHEHEHTSECAYEPKLDYLLIFIWGNRYITSLTTK